MNEEQIAWWRNQYDLAGNDVGIWADRAFGLAVAADVLDGYGNDVMEEITQAAVRLGQHQISADQYARLRVAPPAAMLRAMAVESYLKALWLARGHRLASDGHYRKVLEGRQNEHDLHVLARHVAEDGVFTITAHELAVLDLASTWITAGRYPIPKRYDAIQPLTKGDGGEMKMRTEFHPEAAQVLRALVRRLAESINELGSAGPLSTAEPPPADVVEELIRPKSS